MGDNSSSLTYVGECKDIFNRCKYYASLGACQDKRYEKWVRSRCAKTCQFCGKAAMIISNTMTDFSIELIEGLRSKALNIVIILSSHIILIEVQIVSMSLFLFLLFCSYSVFLNVT